MLAQLTCNEVLHGPRRLVRVQADGDVALRGSQADLGSQEGLRVHGDSLRRRGLLVEHVAARAVRDALATPLGLERSAVCEEIEAAALEAAGHHRRVLSDALFLIHGLGRLRDARCRSPTQLELHIDLRDALIEGDPREALGGFRFAKDPTEPIGRDVDHLDPDWRRVQQEMSALVKHAVADAHHVLVALQLALDCAALAPIESVDAQPPLILGFLEHVERLVVRAPQFSSAQVEDANLPVLRGDGEALRVRADGEPTRRRPVFDQLVEVGAHLGGEGGGPGRAILARARGVPVLDAARGVDADGHLQAGRVVHVRHGRRVHLQRGQRRRVRLRLRSEDPDRAVLLGRHCAAALGAAGRVDPHGGRRREVHRDHVDHVEGGDVVELDALVRRGGAQQRAICAGSERMNAADVAEEVLHELDASAPLPPELHVAIHGGGDHEVRLGHHDVAHHVAVHVALLIVDR
eukprot:scaffold7779_cov239-Pinguiococcus_pyrenoidosus.AAC.2